MPLARTLDTPTGGKNYADLLRSVIGRVYAPQRYAAKRLAQDARTSHRTAERWIAGERVPTGEHFLSLLRECKELREELNRLIDEKANNA